MNKQYLYRMKVAKQLQSIDKKVVNTEMEVIDNKERIMELEKVKEIENIPK